MFRRAVAVAVLIAGLALTSDARSPAEVRAFRAENPCPATSRRSGPCPGWEVDHIRPLCAGGLDKPSNMQWIRKDDHRFKTHVDVRECRKLRRGAGEPDFDGPAV